MTHNPTEEWNERDRTESDQPDTGVPAEMPRFDIEPWSEKQDERSDDLSHPLVVGRSGTGRSGSSTRHSTDERPTDNSETGGEHVHE